MPTTTVPPTAAPAAHRAPTASFILDDRGTVLGFDEGLEALTGWSAVHVVGRSKDRIEGASGCVRLYDGEIEIPAAAETILLRLYGRDGRSLEIEALARRLPGPGARAQVNVLRVLARSPRPAVAAGVVLDPLTGLLPERAFRERIDAAIDAARDRARPVSLVVADVDHLRKINDEFGRPTGDRVLERIADLLRAVVGDDAGLGRLGGDEFAVLLPGSGRGDARQTAASLRSHVERFRFGTDEAEDVGDVRVTLSIGAASYPTDATGGRDLVERAGEALDEARALGRNRVWCYLRRPRVPVEVPVYFDGSDGLLVGYTRDLSPSGVFVQTSAPIDIGMRCAFNFPLPGQAGKVHVVGRVVRAVPPDLSPATAGRIRIPGMGVEFERFGGPRDRRAIATFLHGRQATTLRPERGVLSV